ncbi:uncharacterized protein LOC130139490 [Syzygium oleosum]|uniref:uncharacterized protein LOC130139490 n=1 Tax=Syzygium oleosum TaxID=219896 RepID=UPI0024B90D79|nr:uncharacterized protein LOC130139490 [Syzygium oleosum]
MALSFIKDLWNKWNIRGFMILSLSLHIFLHLFAPLRRKTKNSRLTFLLWLANLMGDWIVVLTVRLISSDGGHPFAHVTKVDNALQVFWTSFLWLHLGTPGTIIILTLNDSRWGQNLLSLTFPSDKVLALYLSSLQRLRKSILLRHKNSNSKENKSVLKTLKDEFSDDELPESIVVKHAHCFFQIFKVFLPDLMFSSQHRNDSRDYFHKVSAVNALRVISVELQFFYELLHTKVLVTRSKWSYFFRFIAFTNVVMAFVLFSRLKKHRFPVLDVEITYCLLIGGIAIDVIALFELVFSDWTVVEIMCHNIRSSKLGSLLHKLVSATDGLRRPRFITCEVDPNANVPYEVLNTPLVFRRWSESIFACNLLSESLKYSLRKKYNRNRHRDTFYPRASRKPFIKELWIFIFGEVKRKSEFANDPAKVRKIFNARGDLFLKSTPGDFDCRNLLKYVTNTYYNDNIIAWHIATEIWYHKEKVTPKNDERKFSKILSDYMLYLLLKQPNLVSAVAVAGIAQMKSVEIFSELRRLQNLIKKRTDMNELCDKLFKVPIEQPHEGDSRRWRSPLKGGLRLAREMERLRERKWEVMSGVWVEMLSYAASHIKGEAHVQVLSRGGELLAFVWLLMAHFGCLHKTGWGMYYEPWADSGSDGNDAMNGGEDDSESDGDDAMVI